MSIATRIVQPGEQILDVQNLDVVIYPHPALRWVAKPVPQVTPLVQAVARRMIEIMHDYKGIGLAATQVAVPWRIFVTCVNDKDLVFINPEVFQGRNEKDKNPRMVFEPESCLSFPGLYLDLPIKRSRDVYVKALDIDGKPFAMSGGGMFAKVAQHESNHLDGILFIDHIPVKSEDIEGWKNYLATQYKAMQNFAVPKFGSDEDEKNKLVNLERLLTDGVT